MFAAPPETVALALRVSPGLALPGAAGYLAPLEVPWSQAA